MTAARPVIRGVAAPLPRENIDTDQIIPKHHLITVERQGLGRGLFSEWRFARDGTERQDFVLNQPAFRNAKILVAGANFGCGSSREHAVWALLDYGIEAVVSPAFASIFEENAAKNALATIRLPEADVHALLAAIDALPGAEATVDLQACMVVAPDGQQFRFEMAPARRRALIEGLDEIAMTLERADRIAAFQQRDRQQRPWVYDVPGRRAETPVIHHNHPRRHT